MGKTKLKVVCRAFTLHALPHWSAPRCCNCPELNSWPISFIKILLDSSDKGLSNSVLYMEQNAKLTELQGLKGKKATWIPLEDHLRGFASGSIFICPACRVPHWKALAWGFPAKFISYIVDLQFTVQKADYSAKAARGHFFCAAPRDNIYANGSKSSTPAYQRRIIETVTLKAVSALSVGSDSEHIPRLLHLYNQPLADQL